MILPKEGKLLRLSSDLPVLVETVATEAKIESFLAPTDVAIGAGLARGEQRDRTVHIKTVDPVVRLLLRRTFVQLWEPVGWIGKKCGAG